MLGLTSSFMYFFFIFMAKIKLLNRDNVRAQIQFRNWIGVLHYTFFYKKTIFLPEPQFS